MLYSQAQNLHKHVHHVKFEVPTKDTPTFNLKTNFAEGCAKFLKMVSQDEKGTSLRKLSTLSISHLQIKREDLARITFFPSLRRLQLKDVSVNGRSTTVVFPEPPPSKLVELVFRNHAAARDQLGDVIQLLGPSLQSIRIHEPMGWGWLAQEQEDLGACKRIWGFCTLREDSCLNLASFELTGDSRGGRLVERWLLTLQPPSPGGGVPTRKLWTREYAGEQSLPPSARHSRRVNLVWEDLWAAE